MVAKSLCQVDVTTLRSYQEEHHLLLQLSSDVHQGREYLLLQKGRLLLQSELVSDWKFAQIAKVTALTNERGRG